MHIFVWTVTSSRGWVLGALSKRCHHTRGRLRPLLWPLGSCTASPCTSKSVAPLELISVKAIRSVSGFFLVLILACGCPLAPAQFVEEADCLCSIVLPLLQIS